ncbi:MAG: hypothetical protein EZS28_048760, partial [Streblomastix strix]
IFNGFINGIQQPTPSTAQVVM